MDDGSGGETDGTPDAGSHVSRPDWWLENEAYRERFDLPEYNPPVFEDGRFTHEVIEGLESEHDCTIRIRSVNATYPDDLDVRIDGETAFSIGRYRTQNGNTVYEMTAPEFRERVEAHRTEPP